MDPEDGCRILLRNVHNYLQIDMVTYSRIFYVHACSGVGRIYFWVGGRPGRIITMAAPTKMTNF